MSHDFKYLSEESDNNILDLAEQKGVYFCKYMPDFEKFKEELPGKGKSHSSLNDRKITDKEFEHAINVLKKI